MIVELRIYSCTPGRTAEFVALYEKMAWPIQKKYLGHCLGWYTSIEGSLNTIVHLWQFASQADREERRRRMADDPAFGAYLKAMGEAGLLQKMENRILTPTEFCPQP